MPTIQKLPSGRYRAMVRIKGISRSANFESRREASAWANAIEVQARDAAVRGVAQPPAGTSLADLIDLYEQHGMLDKTGRTKAATFRMLRRELGGITLRTLGPIHLRDFIDRRQAAGAGGVTIAADLSYLGGLLKWARIVRRLDVDPRIAAEARAGLAERKLSTRSAERDRLPTAGELQRLHAYWLAKPAMRIDMPLVTRFAVASCMRISEICRLTGADVDVQQKAIWIRDRKHPTEKAGNDQLVPLVGDAWTIVQERMAERGEGFLFPWGEKSASTAFTRACKALGIVGLRLHDLRHAGVTAMFRMGLSIEQVALISGHKDWKMLRRYTQLGPADVHAAIERHAPAATASQPTAPATAPAKRGGHLRVVR